MGNGTSVPPSRPNRQQYVSADLTTALQEVRDTLERHGPVSATEEQCKLAWRIAKLVDPTGRFRTDSLSISGNRHRSMSERNKSPRSPTPHGCPPPSPERPRSTPSDVAVPAFVDVGKTAGSPGVGRLRKSKLVVSGNPEPGSLATDNDGDNGSDEGGQNFTLSLMADDPRSLMEAVQNPSKHRELVNQLRLADGMLRLAADLTGSTTENLEETLAIVQDQAARLMECESCRLFIPDGDELVMPGLGGNLLHAGRVEKLVLATQQSIVLTNPYNDERFDASLDIVTGVKSNNLLCVPVRYKEKTVAVAELINKRSHTSKEPFQSMDMGLFNSLCSFIGVCIANAQLFKVAKAERETAQSILQVAKELAAHSFDKDSLVLRIIENARKLLNADRCALFLLDHKRNQLAARFHEDSPEVRMPMDSGIAGVVAKTGATLNIKDAYADVRFNRLIDQKTGYQTETILCMPVKYEDTVVAVAQLVNRRGGPFETHDETLFEAFATFAGVCLRNSIMVDERARANHKAELLLDTVWKLSTTDVQHQDKVVDVIIENARKLVNADRCALFLMDEKRSELVATVKMKQNKKSEPANVTQAVRFPIGKGIAGHVAASGETVLCLKAYEDPRFNKEIDRLTGYVTHSILCMPVMYDSSIVAVAQLINKKEGKFGPEDEELFRAFSAFAGFALRNTMVYTEKVHANRQREILLDAIKNLSHTSLANGTEVIRTIIRGAQEMANCDRCALFLVDKERFELYSEVAEETDQQLRLSMWTGIAGHVARSGEAVNIEEAYNDSRFNKEIDALTGYTTKSLLCMPVMYDTEIIGVAQLVNKNDGVFDSQDEEILQAFAMFAGVSLWNSHLYNHVLTAQNKALDLHHRVHAPAQVPIKPTSVNWASTHARRLSAATSTTLTPAEMESVRHHDFPIHDYGDRPEALLPYVIHIFDSIGLLQMFNVPVETFGRFLIVVQDSYRAVPYHNWFHAFDVTQTLYTWVRACHMTSVLNELDVYLLLIAGLCHDLDHMGLNNSFQYKAETPLGILSSQSGVRSALEVHHCNLTIDILGAPETNILHILDDMQTRHSWRLLIDAILATDMANHDSICEEFAQVLKEGYHRDDLTHRILLVKMLLKAADISNIAKRHHLTVRWSYLLTEEFTSQGTEEKRQGLQVTPTFDDETVSQIANTQIDFIDSTALPLFRQLHEVLPELQLWLDNIVANRLSWQDRLASQQGIKH